jgi:hypothetical protein
LFLGNGSKTEEESSEEYEFKFHWSGPLAKATDEGSTADAADANPGENVGPGRFGMGWLADNIDSAGAAAVI